MAPPWDPDGVGTMLGVPGLELFSGRKGRGGVLSGERRPQGPHRFHAAGQLLRVRAVWVTPIAVTAVLVFLMTLFYVGSVVNPAGHLSGLPVLIADQDRGATVGSQHVDIGAEVASALKARPPWPVGSRWTRSP